jgi:hypothetical protein
MMNPMSRPEDAGARSAFAGALVPLTAATYGEILRRPLYSILLLAFAVAVFLSRFLTLFSFHQEVHMVREMGIATLTFWTFLVIVVTSGTVVTQELEDRTAVTLLSKPVRRADFLLGKFFGIWLSLLPGTLVLAATLLLTLWTMSLPHLPLGDADLARAASSGRSPFGAAWAATWESFLRPQGAVVLQGTMLAIFQAAILAALAVSFAAFFPAVVSAAAVTLAFILGNVSSYMLASVENLGVAPLTASGRALAYVTPNFGYFNLQAAFSEGRIVSVRYVGLSLAYAVLFVSAVFLVSCSLFRQREVR